MGILEIVLPVCGLCLLVAIAGVVLLIVGIVRKNTAMWGSAIGMVALAILLFIGAVVMGIYAGVRTATQTIVAAGAPEFPAAGAPEFPSVAALSDMADLDVSEWFQSCTGVAPPEGVRIRSAKKVTSSQRAAQSRYYLKMEVPGTFGAFLEEHFTKADWSDVKDAMTGPDTQSMTSWDLAGPAGMSFYTLSYRRMPDDPDHMATYIAYDRADGVVYFASVQVYDQQPPEAE